MRTPGIACLLLCPCLAVAAGCGGSTAHYFGDLGGSSDLSATPHDGGAPDLAPPADLIGADLSGQPAVDFSFPNPVDFSLPVDFRPPPPDFAVPVFDLSQPPTDLTVVNPPDQGQPFADLIFGCQPKINEILTGILLADGGASYEYIEIVNPCGQAIDLTGWKLVYRSAANVNPPAANGDSSSLVTFPAQSSIAAFSYLLYGGPNYGGMVDGTLKSGIAASGSVALRDANSNIVDSVAWGAVMMGNAFIETQPAPQAPTVMPPGDSIGRLPNGIDTNNNSVDFVVSATPTPRSANK